MKDVMREVEILLVEDNATDAELAIRALKKRKLANSLVWMKNGGEALDFIFGRGDYRGRSLERGPHVIFLDLRLPKVDGIEVLRRIKHDERTRAIPVVVLTSSEEEKDVTESYQLGVNSYINKPMEFEEFVEKVAELGFYWLLVNRSPLQTKE